MEQLTVGTLFEKLKQLLEEYPEAVDWKVFHVEFGGITKSYSVDIEINKQEPDSDDEEEYEATGEVVIS